MEETALVDSGATESFVNQETLRRLKLGTMKLTRPQITLNVDGTPNKAGTISQAVHLYVTLGKKEKRILFFVTT